MQKQFTLLTFTVENWRMFCWTSTKYSANADLNRRAKCSAYTIAHSAYVEYVRVSSWAANRLHTSNIIRWVNVQLYWQIYNILVAFLLNKTLSITAISLCQCSSSSGCNEFGSGAEQTIESNAKHQGYFVLIFEPLKSVSRSLPFCVHSRGVDTLTEKNDCSLFQFSLLLFYGQLVFILHLFSKSDCFSLLYGRIICHFTVFGRWWKTMNVSENHLSNGLDFVYFSLPIICSIIGSKSDRMENHRFKSTNRHFLFSRKLILFLYRRESGHRINRFKWKILNDKPIKWFLSFRNHIDDRMKLWQSHWIDRSAHEQKSICILIDSVIC